MSPVPVEAGINIKNAVANKAVEAILKKISMAFEKASDMRRANPEEDVFTC